MRVYTEVIFEWDEAQGKLVETSSQSEEYSGEVALCEAYTGNGWKAYRKRYYADTTGDGKYDGEMKIQYYVNGSIKDASGNKHARITRYRLVTVEPGGTQVHWMNKDSSMLPHKSVVDGKHYAKFHDEAAIDKHLEEAGKYLSERSFPTEHANWTADRKEGETEATIKLDDDQAMEDLGAVAATATDSLNLLTRDWQRIATGDSEYHRTVDAAIDDLARAGLGVEGETYTDPEDPNKQIDVLGDIARERQAYKTSITQAQEDFEKDRNIGYAGVTRSLEDMTTGIVRAGEAMETGLEAAREGFTPAIRQAEAAAAATGFAGTGAGEVAREALAEELMEDVGAVETGFTEAREDLQLGHERTVEDFVTDMGGLVTERDRAIEGAGTALGGAEAVYAGLKANLAQIKTTQHKAAQNALRGIQTDMAAIISDTRTTMDNNTWDPFNIPDSELSGKDKYYGWLDPGFDPAEAEKQVTIEGM